MAKALKSRPAETSAGYDEDYHLWLVRQVDLLRAHRLDAIDAAMIAEELDDMGKSERRALEAYYTMLITHLLKWRFQPDRRSASWETTIKKARRAIARREADSPSLRVAAPDLVASVYGDAREDAVDETRLPEGTFPDSCPFSIDELRDTSYWPD